MLTVYFQIPGQLQMTWKKEDQKQDQSFVFEVVGHITLTDQVRMIKQYLLTNKQHPHTEMHYTLQKLIDYTPQPNHTLTVCTRAGYEFVSTSAPY